MRCEVRSVLSIPSEHAWQLLIERSCLVKVCLPLVRFEFLGELKPEKLWIQGQMVRCNCFIFGFLPTGTRELFFERIDAKKMEIQTREKDPLIKKWDHLMAIKDLGQGKSSISDSIEIDAGAMTFVVWLWAQWLYRHRHRRWKNYVAL